MSDLEKIEQFIAEFKKTWVYDLLTQTLSEDAIFEHVFNPDGTVVWFKEQTRQMWFFWSNVINIPDGFILLPNIPHDEMLWTAWEALPLGKPSTNRKEFNERFMFLYSELVELYKFNQNKYDWTEIPENVLYMATDEDGCACGWLVEPAIQGNAWRHQSHLSAYFYIQRPKNPFKGDWRYSLEKRPNK